MNILIEFDDMGGKSTVNSVTVDENLELLKVKNELIYDFFFEEILPRKGKKIELLDDKNGTSAIS